MRVKHLSYAILVGISSLLLVCSCGKKQSSPSPAVQAPIIDSVATNEVQKPELQANDELNDAARLVAGLPVGPENEELYAITQTTQWQDHARRMETIWNSYQQVGSKAVAFAQAELQDANEHCKTLFYPFGGPDYLFSNTFFPNMDTYFLIGLERAGSPIKVVHPSTSTYRLYQKAVSDILNMSFFRTNDMKVELTNDTIDGVVPIISMLMVRSNRKLVDIKNVKLTDSGEIVEADEKDLAANKKKGMVEFTYFQEGSDRLQKLYFLSADLSNGGFLNNEGLKAYVDRLDASSTVTFIKSASYLMHSTYFSGIRNAVLAHSCVIMQDDSGIPWTCYEQDKWALSLYGSFDKPIPMFGKYVQPELKNAYELEATKPINFRIGYARNSNLQIARKKS